MVFLRFRINPSIQLLLVKASYFSNPWHNNFLKTFTSGIRWECIKLFNILVSFSINNLSLSSILDKTSSFNLESNLNQVERQFKKSKI